MSDSAGYPPSLILALIISASRSYVVLIFSSSFQRPQSWTGCRKAWLSRGAVRLGIFYAGSGGISIGVYVAFVTVRLSHPTVFLLTFMAKDLTTAAWMKVWSPRRPSGGIMLEVTADDDFAHLVEAGGAS